MSKEFNRGIWAFSRPLWLRWPVKHLNGRITNLLVDMGWRLRRCVQLCIYTGLFGRSQEARSLDEGHELAYGHRNAKATPLT